MENVNIPVGTSDFRETRAGGYIIESIEPNLTYDILHSSEKISGHYYILLVI